MVERLDGAGVLAGSIARFLGRVEFRDIFNLNHFTLPSRSLPAAPGAAE
jgi:hypothetical protein